MQAKRSNPLGNTTMNTHSFTFEAIGTHWQIDINANISSQEQKELLQKITNRIEIFDQTYSRFRKDSLVTKVVAQPGTHLFPADAPPLFTIYQNLYKATGGAFTPLIGKTISEAGYDSNYSFKQQPLSAPLPLQSITFKGRKITTTRPLLIDVGAAGKGYLIDLIGELLAKEKFHDFCIDAGGDILQSDTSNNQIRVGLEHPEHADQVIGVVNIANKSICGSAGNRRKWGDFHHIINANTLASPTDIIATWVVTDTALVADAIATCLFFTPAEELLPYYQFEYLSMYADHTVKKSSHFPGKLFYN